MRKATYVLTAMAAMVGLCAAPGVAQTYPGMPAGVPADAAAAAAAAQAAAMQQAGGIAAPTFKPTVLTEAKLKGFFNAVEQYRALGDKGAALSADPSKPEAFARGMHFSGAAQEILTKNGFSDAAEFQSVAYNAAMAYGILEQGGKEAVTAKMAEAKARQQAAIADLEKRFGPEQAKVFAAQMAGGMKVAESMQDVPDENLALIERYRAEMEALNR